jgi:hypothetical protein
MSVGMQCLLKTASCAEMLDDICWPGEHRLEISWKREMQQVEVAMTAIKGAEIMVAKASLGHTTSRSCRFFKENKRYN